MSRDFLEAAEYFVLEEDQIVTVDYRYQWMDGAKQSLRKRWDNTPDHPGLNGFPHHVHIDREENVAPGQPLNLLELLTILENELL